MYPDNEAVTDHLTFNIARFAVVIQPCDEVLCCLISKLTWKVEVVTFKDGIFHTLKYSIC